MEPDLRDFEYWPLGARWPWLPRFTGKMRPRPIAIDELAPGESVNLSFECEIVGNLVKERIGIRRWVRHHWERFREWWRAEENIR